MSSNGKTALFINPPSGLYRRDDRCQSRVEDQTVRVVFEPVELAVYAAIFEQAGWKCHIRDYPAMGGSWARLEKDLVELDPDFLLFAATTPTIRSDLEVCAMAKRQRQGIMVVGKGDYLSLRAEDVLRHTPQLDAILIGEPELTLMDLASGARPAEIDGVAFRDPRTRDVVAGSARPFLQDLDLLPRPARHLLDNDLYRSPETGRRMGVIHANRGCPADCTFCNVGRVYGKRLRQRSPANIVAELEECVERYNIREFLFHGDTFTLNPKWTVELCKKIVEQGLRIRWGCNSRVDTIDPERLRWMKRAGCWVVAFGVESGDQKMLDEMKKGITIDQIRRAFQLTREAGIATHAFFIAGMPNESRQTLARTLALARELDPDFFDFNIAYPLPGTEFYEQARSAGLFNEETLPYGSYGQAAIRTRFLSNEDLTRWRRRALLGMYLRPRYILRTLYQARSPNRIYHYLRAAFLRMRTLMTTGG